MRGAELDPLRGAEEECGLRDSFSAPRIEPKFRIPDSSSALRIEPRFRIPDSISAPRIGANLIPLAIPDSGTHYEYHALCSRDIVRRIAVDSDEISFVTCCD